MATDAAGGDPITQLNAARQLSLRDPKLYSQIVPGVLPMIGPQAPLEFRRWGADFLSETFASPVLPPDMKTELALKALKLLSKYIQRADEDLWVIKSTVQAVASCYPLVFKYIIDNPNKGEQWQIMAAIKSSILRRMDTATPGVRVCCIKFLQRVVQTQSPGVIADPRRPEQNEISLAMVPRDHPVIPPPNLEAEASGLLDRLLSILQENSSDALLVTATLNSLGGLIRSRSSIANKIINAVLGFNPLKLGNAPMTPKTRVLIKSMERTTRSLLVAIIKKNPNHPLGGRIHQYVERLQHSRNEIFDDTNRKRAAPVDSIHGAEAKRQRMATASAKQEWPPPLPSGPITVADLFSLTRDPVIRNFDVKTVSLEHVVQCVVPLLQIVDQAAIDRASNAVRARLLALADNKTQTAPGVSQTGSAQTADEDDDDDYEPDYQPQEDAEQMANRMDQDASAVDAMPPEVALGPFRLPTPPALSGREIEEWSKGTVMRVYGHMSALDDPSKKVVQLASGFNRLAGRNQDRDAWVTVLSRLATRASAGLECEGFAAKEEQSGANGAIVRKLGVGYNMADGIRESMYLYVMQDFRRKIDIAISWLNEEWYNDRIMQRAYEEELAASSEDHFAASEKAAPSPSPPPPPRHYEKWLLRMLDGFLPYLDARDKVLMRFVSELPVVDVSVMERIKKLALDPERVQLTVMTLQYLVMLKPPAREIALDALEDMWRNNSDAKNAAAKVLVKWRPMVLQPQLNGSGAGDEVKAEANIEAKA